MGFPRVRPRRNPAAALAVSIVAGAAPSRLTKAAWSPVRRPAEVLPPRALIVRLLPIGPAQLPTLYHHTPAESMRRIEALQHAAVARCFLRRNPIGHSGQPSTGAPT